MHTKRTQSDKESKKRAVENECAASCIEHTNSNSSGVRKMCDLASIGYVSWNIFDPFVVWILVLCNRELEEKTQCPEMNNLGIDVIVIQKDHFNETGIERKTRRNCKAKLTEFEWTFNELFIYMKLWINTICFAGIRARARAHTNLSYEILKNAMIAIGSLGSQNANSRNDALQIVK